MATLSTPNHPRWCVDRDDRCAQRGAHHGREVTLRAIDGQHPPVTVQMAQARLFGDPYVTIRSEAGFVVLTIGQARALAYALANRARIAGVTR